MPTKVCKNIFVKWYACDIFVKWYACDNNGNSIVTTEKSIPLTYKPSPTESQTHHSLHLVLSYPLQLSSPQTLFYRISTVACLHNLAPCRSHRAPQPPHHKPLICLPMGLPLLLSLQRHPDGPLHHNCRLPFFTYDISLVPHGFGLHGQ
jgi:hypothetical protein